MVVVVVAARAQVQGGIVILSPEGRGWIRSNGDANGRNAGNNTITGSTADYIGEFRSWFSFDMSGITDAIVAAEFRVDISKYMSSDSSEMFQVVSVEETPGIIGTGSSVAHFNDLGGGTVYGLETFTVADENVLSAISLTSAAIADLNDARGGLFELGGHLTTWSGQILHDGSIFWGSGPSNVTELRLTTSTAIPEPASLLIWGVAVLGVAVAGAARRRRRQKQKDG